MLHHNQIECSEAWLAANEGGNKLNEPPDQDQKEASPEEACPRGSGGRRALLHQCSVFKLAETHLMPRKAPRPDKTCLGNFQPRGHPAKPGQKQDQTNQGDGQSDGVVGITDCSPDSITEIPQLLSGAASLCRV